MSAKQVLISTTTAAVLAASLLLPAGALAHGGYRGDHYRHDERGHWERHTHRHRHKHGHRWVHGHRYRPVLVPVLPRYWDGYRYRGDYRGRNQFTIIYRGDWD